MTIANSLPSSRRGNVWALVGAFSVEVNGSLVISVRPCPFKSSNFVVNCMLTMRTLRTRILTSLVRNQVQYIP
eukprot:scaffold535796_cov51-Prasinocladus_malaysianus.AAC.1